MARESDRMVVRIPVGDLEKLRSIARGNRRQLLRILGAHATEDEMVKHLARAGIALAAGMETDLVRQASE